MKCELCGKATGPDDPDFAHVDCRQKQFVPASWSGIGKRYDPERILNEEGVEKLQQSAEGRMVLDRARAKYKAELVQPGDPEFNKLYGKEIKDREEARKANVEISKKMWESRNK